MTEFSNQDKQLMAALAGALEALDAAIGRPYEAGPMRTRVAAWLHACRGMPVAAIEWATATACARLERYPSAAQFRSLAQGSPAYRATLEQRHPALAVEVAAPDLPRCPECDEPRAWHRVRPYAGAPRPLVIRGIRHRDTCARSPDMQWWVDPPLFGQLTEGGEGWRAFAPEWEPPTAPAPRTGAPTKLDGTTLDQATDDERADRAAAYKAAAKGGNP